MPRVPLSSLGVVVALLGAGLALVTFFRPPVSSETHILPAGVRKDEMLIVNLSSPAWLRSGVAEEVVLILRRESPGESQEPWLAAAELHAGGGVVTPSARRGGPLGPGDQVEYRWSVTAGSQGSVPMEISVRRQRGGPGEGEILWAQGIRPQVRDYLGMDAAEARAAGLLGALAGILTTLIGRRVKGG